MTLTLNPSPTATGKPGAAAGARPGADPAAPLPLQDPEVLAVRWVLKHNRLPSKRSRASEIGARHSGSSTCDESADDDAGGGGQQLPRRKRPRQQPHAGRQRGGGGQGTAPMAARHGAFGTGGHNGAPVSSVGARHDVARGRRGCGKARKEAGDSSRRPERAPRERPWGSASPALERGRAGPRQGLMEHRPFPAADHRDAEHSPRGGAWPVEGGSGGFHDPPWGRQPAWQPGARPVALLSGDRRPYRHDPLQLQPADRLKEAPREGRVPRRRRRQTPQRGTPHSGGAGSRSPSPPAGAGELSPSPSGSSVQHDYGPWSDDEDAGAARGGGSGSDATGGASSGSAHEMLSRTFIPDSTPVHPHAYSSRWHIAQVLAASACLLSEYQTDLAVVLAAGPVALIALHKPLSVCANHCLSAQQSPSLISGSLMRPLDPGSSSNHHCHSDAVGLPQTASRSRKTDATGTAAGDHSAYVHRDSAEVRCRLLHGGA